VQLTALELVHRLIAEIAVRVACWVYQRFAVAARDAKLGVALTCFYLALVRPNERKPRS
jgi:hypothetical protein